MYKRQSNLAVNSPMVDKPMTRYNLARPVTFVTPNSQGFIYSVTYQGPLLWSGLPNAVKVLDILADFQREIKRMLKEEMSLLPKI